MTILSGVIFMKITTISTHNGSEAHRSHNIRKDYVVANQTHIDQQRTADNEILIDEEPRQAYQRIFCDSLADYNEKQTRADRKIKDYYQHICKDKKKHAVYEMIVQVGGQDDNIPLETHKKILKSFLTGWKQQNPNLEVIGAYLHADEATPHLHLDYVPVAHGYKNGLAVQSSLVKALGEQGIRKNGKETAQIQWQKTMNMLLESICKGYGLKVEHPRLGTIHLDTEMYKLFRDALITQHQKEINFIKNVLKKCSETTHNEFRDKYNEMFDKNIVNVEDIAEQVTDNFIKKQQQQKESKLKRNIPHR
jgi:hypothetical protein